MSSASPSSLRGAAVPIHTKIDTPASKSNTSASGNSAADLERQEQTHSFATKEAFRVVGQATPTSAQSDAKQTHNKPDPIGAYTPPAAPLTDKDHDERVAPKGFGAYIRRIGREQNGMPENDVSSPFGARRAQHPEEEPTADRPMHRGGESPVPSARLHTNRSPTMSSDTSPSTVTLGSRDSVEDLEHKVLHHLNTGKLAALTVPQLRAFLQQQKMPSAGKKKELIHEIERWWQAAHQQKH
ncbi:hypothetical protein F1559_003619 [Cyanidiococcus yangmingshanensis]|uniref:SAP domain-containing protein n=1 Tax=Cyanidiococcus yangmingshanensis TaxID=2690220 RepID=A0A7J7IG39_9RHOD|nr:hypothetical protein F1559_003619 [Cyanidiococcus yangmingshanensis]